MLKLQKALGVEPLQLVRPSGTRWLSYQQSVQNLKLTYVALVQSLTTEVEDRRCVKANGFLKKIKKWKFVYCLEMLDLILPTLAKLSKVFQVSGKNDNLNLQYLEQSSKHDRGMFLVFCL